MKGFEWQEGYGAFTIGVSQVDHTIKYISNQQVHHRKKTFREEFIEFLNAVILDIMAWIILKRCSTLKALRFRILFDKRL